MPLMQNKSKKAFSKNVATEMHEGKPQGQALAIAYSVKRKPKKKASGGTVKSGSPDMNYVDGGEVSAKSEKRPMPDNRYNDSKEVSRNTGNKPSHNDSWTDNSTIEQAQRPSKTKLSRPKLVGSDAFSVRYKSEIDEDLDRMNSMPPETDTAPPPARDNEEGPNRQGPAVSDVAAQHNNKKPPYNKAIEDQYAQDMAAAEMKKTQSYAAGGVVVDEDAMEMSERADEAHMQSRLSPSHDEGDEFALDHEEVDGNRQGPNLRDMEDEHSTGRKPYYTGGSVQYRDAMDYDTQDDFNPAHGKFSPDDSEDQPEDEADMEHEDSIAAAIMSKKKRGAQRSGSKDEDRMTMMALGGELLEDDADIHSHGSMDTYEDEDQADLSRNADEDANEEDQASFDALRKENYSESEGLHKLISSTTSGMRGDDEESDSEDKHDRVSRIMSKMNAKRQFSKR